jgi:hypothetical protein
MALPSSGQISFNDVRTETSQSAKNSYAMSGWTWGLGDTFCGGYGILYAPINVLSSGSRFSESSPLNLSNLSMSAWYNYDHNLYIGLDVTGTLYPHADVNDQCFPTTMLPIELGTTNTTFSINISGTLSVASELLIVTYGKPWRNDATGPIPSTVILTVGTNINTSFDYNYTYDSNVGSKIYCVLLSACP